MLVDRCITNAWVIDTVRWILNVFLSKVISFWVVVQKTFVIQVYAMHFPEAHWLSEAQFNRHAHHHSLDPLHH